MRVRVPPSPGITFFARHGRKIPDTTPMPAIARVTDSWKNTKLIAGLMIFAMALYFFFDALVGYPRSDERYLKHKEYMEKGDLNGWKTYAKSRNWSAKPPEKYLGPGKVIEQWVFGGFLMIVGSGILGYWATQKGRVVQSDDQAVVSPSGRRIPYSAITGLGVKHWETKGLAKVRYSIEGKKGEFELDDYKYDRDATKEIFSDIEAALKARAEGEESPVTAPDGSLSKEAAPGGSGPDHNEPSA